MVWYPSCVATLRCTPYWPTLASFAIFLFYHLRTPCYLPKLSLCGIMLCCVVLSVRSIMLCCVVLKVRMVLRRSRFVRDLVEEAFDKSVDEVLLPTLGSYDRYY